MKVCILTLGSRGDVQPYIALGLGLKAAGHEVTISTLEEFKPLVHEYGLLHDNLRGDFLKVAQSTIGQNGGNPLQRIRQYVEMARDTLADEWASAQKADVLIYNPAAIGGFHIAEKLNIPTFAAFPAPLYSPTREFPNPFLPFRNLGIFNKLSHKIFTKMGPTMYRTPIKQFRQDVLGLPPAKGENLLRGRPITKLYAYSETAVPRPADWDESSVVTGYWFLDAPANWQPDPELVRFLQEGAAPVYIGFGSMFMGGGKQKTEIVLEALRVAGQRGILATGWGGLTGDSTAKDVFVLDAVPHDWLFPQVAAVVHHGGAGTTGAALRAGKPQVICPFVGDQFFWGRRMADLGVSPRPISQIKLTAERLADAIQYAVTNTNLQQRASSIGETIRAENGVECAVKNILSNG
ncbi:MAG TPA: glycosyltransferase [Chloroflexota bacterium]|nr:glycosyltransferase [Chloroflexota bacterium]HUM67430.1 glycosyltransferase [Chloroflexota bacterium]